MTNVTSTELINLCLNTKSNDPLDTILHSNMIFTSTGDSGFLIKLEEDDSYSGQCPSSLQKVSCNNKKIINRTSTVNAKRDFNRRLRMEGKPYLGFSTTGGKMKQNILRKGKEMGRRCESDFCKKSRLRDCEDISEEQRLEIFNRFWRQMNWDQRKMFVARHVIRKPKETHRTSANDSRRKSSLEYSLTVKEPNGSYCVKQVCKNMFSKTLCLGKFQIHAWTS